MSIYRGYLLEFKRISSLDFSRVSNFQTCRSSDHKTFMRISKNRNLNGWVNQIVSWGVWIFPLMFPKANSRVLTYWKFLVWHTPREFLGISSPRPSELKSWKTRPGKISRSFRWTSSECLKLSLCCACQLLQLQTKLTNHPLTAYCTGRRTSETNQRIVFCEHPLRRLLQPVGQHKRSRLSQFSNFSRDVSNRRLQLFAPYLSVNASDFLYHPLHNSPDGSRLHRVEPVSSFHGFSQHGRDNLTLTMDVMVEQLLRCCPHLFTHLLTCCQTTWSVIKVWPLTQFYSIGSSQPRINFKKLRCFQIKVGVSCCGRKLGQGSLMCSPGKSIKVIFFSQKANRKSLSTKVLVARPEVSSIKNCSST